MTDVLIVTNWIPARPSVLADALRQFRDAGARVTIACGCDPGEIPVPDGTAVVRGVQAAKKLPKWDRTVYRESPNGMKLWLRARRDPALRRIARSADVLVALDPNSTHTVWELARRHRGADAVAGLMPALKEVARRAERPGRNIVRRSLDPVPAPAVVADSLRERADRLIDKVARFGLGRRVLRNPRGRAAWRLLLKAPGLGDGRRVHLANQVIERLTKLKLRADANGVRAVVSSRLPADASASWLVKSADDEFKKGRIPTFLKVAAEAELARADRALALGDVVEAGKAVSRTVLMLFNRAAHIDSLMSPAVRDPEAFLAPLHRSAAGKVLAAPRGRRTPAAPPPTGRKHRLLLVTRQNEYFLTEIKARYEQHPDFEVRHLDLAGEESDPLTWYTGQIIRNKLAGQSQEGEQLKEWMTPHLEWADTVFVDWCLGHAAMLSAVDPGTARIIVRLHSYEAFTAFPHLLDLSRVDDLVFVSEPLREFTMAAVPRLRQPGAPRTPVVTNAVRLDRYRRPKTAEARFALGLVGLKAIAKDPLWAFEILREVRRRDDRYQLVLIGSDVDGSPNKMAANYQARYEAELSELEAEGAVRRVGQTDDVAAALTDVGVILSTSVRESFHQGLIEGAASGAVPVVRDWPFFAGRGPGAHSIFPADWIVTTPAEAAERILKQNASEETWRKAGDAAADHAMATWDWSVTQAQYDRLLLHPDGTPYRDQAN